MEPIADFGGNASIGSGLVKKALKSGGLLDYHPLDYSTGVDLMKPVKGKYGLGICMDTLEHVHNPVLVGKNISNALKKNALLFVTAPFVWVEHGYDEKEGEKDYFRFTTAGIKLLFSDLECVEIALIGDIEGAWKATKKTIKKLKFFRVVAVFKKTK